MPRLAHAAALASCLAVLPRTQAQSPAADQLPVTVQVLQMVNLPGEEPHLTLHAEDRVDAVNLTVSENGRAVLQRAVGSLQAGAAREIDWRADPGEHDYRVQVSGKTAAGAARV